IEKIESLHHRAGGKQVDLERAATHLVDLGHEVAPEFVEDVLRRPRALELPHDGILRAHDIWHGERSSRGARGDATGLQEFSARCPLLWNLCHLGSSLEADCRSPCQFFCSLDCRLTPAAYAEGWPIR